MVVPRAHFLRWNPWPQQWVQLRWKAEVLTRPACYLRHFEIIVLVRFQDDVLVKNVVTDNLQACGSVVLVVQAAAEHEKIQAETSILFAKK